MIQLEVFVGLSVIIWVLILWLQRSRKYYWKNLGVSYIPGLPIIGCGYTFKGSIGEFFDKLYNDPATKDEPFSGFYFFNQPSLLIRDPELIKRIFVTDFNMFMDRIASSDPDIDVIGNSMLPLAKGDKWKKIRSGITPVFTTMRMKNFFTIVKDISKEFERKLEQETTRGWNEYDVKRLCGFYTVDTLAQCFFGVKSNSLSNPQSPFFVNAVAMAKFTWKRAFIAVTLLFFPGFAKKMKFTFFMESENTFLRESINTVMHQRETMGTKCNDLIDILISMKNTQQDIFHGDVLVGQAATFLFAGYETSSSAISFALYLLAKHPDIQERVRREILEELEKTGDITFEGINDLQYLNMVIQGKI